LRAFPRIVIAQVHGYCLGGALGIMNSDVRCQRF
jgi:enoyl-CoA hydratase/carnithine racemase